jgi:hypothetical protein
MSGGSETLLSYETAVALEIIPTIKSVTENDYSDLCEQYKEVFTSLGKLKGRQIKFHIDESIVPVAQAPRRIPFYIREKVEKLESVDVKIEGPTPWVSNFVVAPKPKAPDEIRICVDMRKANQAIRRERHVTPTIDDITHIVSGSKVFSKVGPLQRISPNRDIRRVPEHD